eukprot:c12750_g1_i1.p1 GENE.c12750_g1_i1~~c12750_g1_i1.p1  ORF type:complete len:312 (-),score=117.01 c12750_g1_i1:39-974(-)
MAYFETIRSLSSKLHQRVYNENETENYIGDVFNLCHNSNPKFKENQIAALESGLVDSLTYFAQNARADDCKMLAFRAIGQMCFENKVTSTQVGKNHELVTLVLNNLNSETNDYMKEEALYSVKNAAANSWETHNIFLQLVPSVVRILRSPTHHCSLRAQCLFFIGVLAYNHDSRISLIDLGCIAPLVEILQSSNQELYPTSAALALACLVGGDKAYDYIFECETKLHTKLLDAFQATLLRRPYPPGSELYFTDWKLMMGLMQLCKNKTAKHAMIEKGLIKMIQVATSQRDKRDPRLTQYALEALWICTAPE